MDILLDALIDSLKLLPVLFLIYLLIEYLEHKNNNWVHHFFMKSEKAGPFFGGLFGCIPQCGFSVIASELYSQKAITIGTLMAVFISTSDEAVPILLADPKRFKDMLLLIIVKLVIAVVAGILIDIMLRRAPAGKPCDEESHEHRHYHGNCEPCGEGILKSAVIHSIKIFVFIFIISIALGFLLKYAGGVFEFITKHEWLQPFITPVIGIIPNCAASVALTKLYTIGGITFGALTGGLCAGAGVGLIVLFQLNKRMKQNFVILFMLYAIGVISGLILQAAGI
ncbi:MAG: putative manganese transporter [Bacillota bacterium]|nr:putative manganese transporter [Bacillota bacterium]